MSRDQPPAAWRRWSGPTYPWGRPRRPGGVALQTCGRIIAVAVAYAVVGRLSLELAFANSNVTAIWPPTGIAVAALLLGGLRLWPGVALGALLANLLNGASPETSTLIAVGNTAAPVLAVVLVRAVLRRKGVAMDSVSDLLALLGIGGLACMTVSATLGTAALVATGALPGRLYTAVWPTWWIGDAMGIVLVAPLLLIAAEAWRTRSAVPRRRLAEGMLVLVVELVVSIEVFSIHAPVAFLMFPFVMWASLRLFLPGAALSVLVISTVSIVQTVHGNGAFANRDVNTALVGLQAFNGAVALTALLLAALSRRAMTAVSSLEMRVASRTAELEESNLRLSLITQAGRELRQLLEPTTVLDRLAYFAVELASSSSRTTGRSTLILIEQNGEVGRVHAEHDLSGRTLCGTTFAVRDQPPIAEVVRTGLPVRAAIDLETFGPTVRPVMEGVPFSHAGYAPILVDGEVFAVLTLAAGGHEIDSSDIDDLQALCEIGGLALSNGRSYQAALDARDEVIAQAADLARSNTDLEQFARVASHDLQEPLRMVTSYVQLLERRYRGRLGEDADEYIAFAVEGSLRMQGLITDLLAYSRAGHDRDDLIDVDTGGCVDAAAANLLSALRDNSGEIVHGDLPHVQASAPQLTQVFQNLIGNALKFHGDAPPRVEVEARREQEFWLFSVHDNGIGIDPQQKERIFQVFQRLHTRERYPGTGIGLALCKKIVERLGGTIWLDPEPGVGGSTFRFTVPVTEG